MPTQQAFSRLLSPGHSVFDVGAGVGFFTLLAHRLVGPAGTVVAFEPHARNLDLLKRHLEINAAEHVMIFEGAVGRQSGIGSFMEGENPSEGRLGASGDLTVPVVALDDFLTSSDAVLPDLIKIDVEGGEVDVLEGATQLLQRKRPNLLVSTHGREAREACLRVLVQLGYECGTLDSLVPSDSSPVLVCPSDFVSC